MNKNKDINNNNNEITDYEINFIGITFIITMGLLLLTFHIADLL